MISMFLFLRGVGGILLILLGLYVASLRPRRRENVAFATFCALTGGGFGSWLIFPTDSAARGLVLVVGGFLFASAGFALARVAIAFPRPLAPAEHALTRNAAIVSILVGLVQGAAYVMRNLTDAAFTSTEVRVGALVEDLGLTAFRSAAWFGGLLAVVRFASVPDAPREHHQALALFGVALAIYPAVPACSRHTTEEPDAYNATALHACATSQSDRRSRRNSTKKRRCATGDECPEGARPANRRAHAT